MSFVDDALSVLQGGLPALADYGSAVPSNVNAFPEQTPPTGTIQNYEPGLYNTNTGLSTGALLGIGLGVAALLVVVVVATR
jgi:hypothetical protein